MWVKSLPGTTASELRSKINEIRVLECVESTGPTSREGLARTCGLSVRTVSRAVVERRCGCCFAAVGPPGVKVWTRVVPTRCEAEFFWVGRFLRSPVDSSTSRLPPALQSGTLVGRFSFLHFYEPLHIQLPSSNSFRSRSRRTHERCRYSCRMP